MTSTTLMTLPRELRDLIYTETFRITEPEDLVEPHLRFEGRTRSFPRLPSLCLTSKQIYFEAIPRLLAVATIHFPKPSSWRCAELWLDTFSEQEAWHAIRTLCMGKLSDYLPDSTVEFVRRCVNLKELRFHYDQRNTETGMQLIDKVQGTFSSVPSVKMYILRSCIYENDSETNVIELRLA
ncbi:hypothetical protein BDV96DRAFT_201492 [Lophiotrema nucula]|uniref:F-box domain-containing protein n=1 Tax=Lophiotrema nucula TaxID=690887 RepID=A0A6A5YW99_9PLEO|nr:hypothetical protein BDV96DRAFT_201492 [Lophiotrema nucula]